MQWHFIANISYVIISEKYSIPSYCILLSIIAACSICVYYYFISIFNCFNFYLIFIFVYFLWFIITSELLRFFVLINECLGLNLSFICVYYYFISIFNCFNFYLIFIFVYYLWFIIALGLLRFFVLINECLGFNLSFKTFKSSTWKSLCLLLTLFPSSENTNTSSLCNWVVLLLFLSRKLHIYKCA